MSAIYRVIRGWLKQKEFFYVALGNLAIAGFGAVLWFVLAKIIYEQFGTVTYLLSVARTVAIVAIFGLDWVVMTYYPKERDSRLIEQSSTLTMLTGIAAVIFLIVFQMALLVPLLLVLVAFFMSLGIEVGRQRYDRYLRLCIIVATLRMTLVTVLCLFFGLVGVIAGYTIATLFVGYEWYKSLRPSLDFSIVKEKLNFAVHSFGARSMGVLLGLVDKVLIGIAFGPEEPLKFYALAFLFFTAFLMLPQSLFTYLLPERASGARRREVEILGVVLSAAIIFFGVFALPIIIQQFFAGFERSILSAQIMTLAIVPATIANIRAAKYMGEERPRRVSATFTAGIVFELVALLVLGNTFGLTGLATALVLTWTIMAILMR